MVPRDNSMTRNAVFSYFIVVLHETKIRDNKSFKFKNLTMYRRCRTNHGWDSPLEILVRYFFNLYICNIYLPEHTNVNTSELDEIIKISFVTKLYNIHSW